MTVLSKESPSRAPLTTKRLSGSNTEAQPPTKRARNLHEKAVQGEAHQLEVFPGVHLPDSESFVEKIADFLNPNAYSVKDTVSFILSSTKEIKDLEGNPKNSLRSAEILLEKSENLAANVPSEDYLFFGNDNNRANELAMFLKTNPFMASALTEAKKGDGFELKSYDPKETNPSRYLQYIRTLNGVGHRVNFEFTNKMKVKSFTVYDDVEGKEIVGKLDINKYASSALYNLIFYASAIHGTMHVLHYLLTAGFEQASRHFKAMHDWAEAYDKSIAIKYLEVGLLLINDKSTAIVTGPDGFGSSLEIRPMLKDLLDTWGLNPTAKGFLDNMMNVSADKMKSAGILSEFMKHFELVESFAADAANALRTIDPHAFDGAEKNLKDYLQQCGTFKSKIDTFDQWLQIMSVTGIVHGSTLSYSRLVAVADVLKWRNIQSSTWDSHDTNILSAGLGTITGMEPGHHVMSSTTGQYDKALQSVLDSFDKKTTKIKEEYESNLIESKDFDDYGYILSDFCRDNFDGKQLTMATYI